MDPKLILNHILSFILALYGNPGLPRKIVQVVVEYMDNFIQSVIVPHLRSEILAILREKNVEHDTLWKVDKCFDKYGSVFEDVSTEAKRFSLSKPKGFINYEKFEIGTTFIQKIVNNDMLLVPDFLCGIHVPLRKTLQLFLQIPGMMKEIEEYIEKLRRESHIISNKMQADLWLKVYSKSFDCLVLPLFLFFDDLETGNPLGSHAGTN